MALTTQARGWIPLLVTFSTWILLVIVLWTYVSKTWADFGGILYLIFTPFIYRSLRNAIGSNSN